MVDSSYLLKRSFHGANDQYTDSFGHIGGLYSFFTTLRKLIKQHKINKVVLMWDGENGGIYRHNIDENYKGNRKDKSWNELIEMSDYEIRKENEKKQSLLKQRKRIQSYAEELFLRQIEVNDIEADDLIAAYCQEYYDKEEIILYTNDRDFSQLLGLDIIIIFANIDIPITKSNFIHYFNYYYSNALTVKIICGDSADNIKGIKGLKEKKLLKFFPELSYKQMSVKDICKRAIEINKEREKQKKKPYKALENLINNIDRLKINYKLMNLSEPILNKESIDEIQQLKMPLSPENRGSKNLYKMMVDDGFLTVYKSTFVNYIEPFYSIIMNEKQILKEYKKNNKEN